MPLLGLSLLALGACSSTGESLPEPDSPLRMTYVLYRSGQSLELVNEAHTNRIEQYSEVRPDAARKVASNEVMAALLEYFHDQDWATMSQQGGAPVQAGSAMAWAIEVSSGDESTFVTMHQGVTEEEIVRLQTYMAAFVDVYNSVYGLQAVELGKGQTPFRNTAGDKR